MCCPLEKRCLLVTVKLQYKKFILTIFCKKHVNKTSNKQNVSLWELNSLRNIILFIIFNSILL